MIAGRVQAGMTCPSVGTRHFSLPDPSATAALGRWLGQQLSGGDTLLLHGPIGAGKTHLARALIQDRLAQVGRQEEVPSPTFTLVQTYDLDRVELWHADLYRLTRPDDVIELGLDEAFTTAICLVEWPDRLGDLVPAGALNLHLSADGAGRRAELRGPAAHLAAMGPGPNDD